MPTLTSDRVNYLVWRYLQEEGLNLSGYAVNKETHVGNLDAELRPGVPEGELVRLLLKGIELAEIESQALDSRTPPAEIDRASDEKALAPPEKVKGFSVLGDPLMGGVASVYTSDQSLIIAGSDTVGIYTTESDDPHAKFALSRALECNDRPTVLVKEAAGVIVGYMSGSLRQWRLDSDVPVLQSVLTPEIDAPLSPVLLIKRSSNGVKAAVVYLDGLICIWDLVERQVLIALNASTATQSAPQSSQNSSRQLSMVTDLVWLSGDANFAVAHAHGIGIYNIESATPTPTLLSRHGEAEKPASVLAYDPIMQLLASGSNDGHVAIWTPGNTAPLREIVASQVPAPVSHVSWLGVYLLTGSTDGSLRVFDVRGTTQTSADSISADTISTDTTADNQASSDSLLVAAVNLNEPVLGVEIRSHNVTNWDSVQLAVLTPVGVRVFNFAQSKFTLIGSFDETGVQSIACSANAFAVTTRESTVIMQ